MTIENEQSKKISNEQLLRDIDLTESELLAYQKLMDIFCMLGNFPENQSTIKQAEYSLEEKKYSGLEQECREFLRKLYQLKKERGII